MRLSEPLRQVFVERGASEEQLEFEWSRIRDRIEPRSKRVVRRGGRIALLAAIGGLVFTVTTSVLSRRDTVVESESKLLEGPIDSTLADGSRIAVPAGGKVRVSAHEAESVRVVIEGGEAAFDVTHRPDRTFTVSAANVLVRVIGTQFKVKLEARPRSLHPAVRVAVSRGAVEVTGAGLSGPVRVQAGDDRLFDGAAELTQAAALPRESLNVDRSDDAPLRGPTDAQRLFEQANLARRAGKAGEAAHLYQVLLSRFPGNRRAGLAALELGRLRMDTLGDLPGAVEALRRAVRSIPGGSLHEDAQARLIDALDGLHDWAGCRRARKDYLRRYRHGVHAIAVDARCAAR